MPLLTTLGASTVKAFKSSLRPPTIWYDNGVPAEGPVLNLQGDSAYHNYANGVDLGVYTGPIYLDNLWKRILFGNLAGINNPEPDLALVNGRYDLGEGLKWYYHGAIADGYVQNLATREIYGDGFTDFFTPVSTLSGWHTFDQGTDNGTITGEYNVDGQGNLWYVDGDLANSPLKLTPDNLWHSFSSGSDLGLLNDFAPGADVPAIVNLNNNTLLIFSGVPFTGNYYASDWHQFWRQERGQTRETQIVTIGAFSFVDGVCTSVLTGDHVVVNGTHANQLSLYRDGEDILLYSSVLRYETGGLYQYVFSLDSGDLVTGNQVTAGFYASYSNIQLPCDTAIPRIRFYLVLDGSLAAAGCRTYNNDVYCIGSDGLIEGWDQYSLYNPEPSCDNCLPYYY